MTVIEWVKDSNKYIIKEPLTPDELKECLSYYVKRKLFRCIICNKNTCKQLNVKPGDNFITINNKVEDGVFYVNRIG